MHTDEFSSTFTVKQLAESENNQTVTCVITNPLGKETSEAFIKVKPAPKLEKEPGDQTVGLEETLKIKIPIIGKGPFTVKLKREDAEAEDLGNRYKINELDGTVTFTLSSI